MAWFLLVVAAIGAALFFGYGNVVAIVGLVIGVPFLIFAVVAFSQGWKEQTKRERLATEDTEAAHRRQQAILDAEAAARIAALAAAARPAEPARDVAGYVLVPLRVFEEWRARSPWLAGDP